MDREERLHNSKDQIWHHTINQDAVLVIGKELLHSSRDQSWHHTINQVTVFIHWIGDVTQLSLEIKVGIEQ